MVRVERPLENASIHHLAISVGDLDSMVAFYGALGFDEEHRADFAPMPISVATVVNASGARLELTANEFSQSGKQMTDPIMASRRRGPFHVALAVANLDVALDQAVAAGASLCVAVAASARVGRFAYIADIEGNLIELVGQ